MAAYGKEAATENKLTTEKSLFVEEVARGKRGYLWSAVEMRLKADNSLLRKVARRGAHAQIDPWKKGR